MFYLRLFIPWAFRSKWLRHLLSNYANIYIAQKCIYCNLLLGQRFLRISNVLTLQDDDMLGLIIQLYFFVDLHRDILIRMVHPQEHKK